MIRVVVGRHVTILSAHTLALQTRRRRPFMLRLRPVHVHTSAIRRGQDGKATDGTITFYSLA
jgi:hypothetical protein